jgi:hypothetical protein
MLGCGPLAGKAGGRHGGLRLGTASLSPPIPCPLVECTAETGSCFSQRISLSDRFARCLCAGGTSSVGCSVGGKSKLGVAVALIAKILLVAWLGGRILSGETGWLGCSVGGKSKFTPAVGLAGGEGPFASLSPPPPHPPAKCTAEKGIYFGPGNLLGVWFVRCLHAGGTSSLGRSAGGKSKFTTALAGWLG